MFSRARDLGGRVAVYLLRNAIALAALFVALGGTAYAVNTIRSSDIVDGEVKTADLGAKAVTAEKIANGAVGFASIAPDAVSGSRVADKSLSGSDLANDTVTGAKIDESTLGQVPGAASLGGFSASRFRPGAASAHQQTDQCVQVGIWRECAAIGITVPAGHIWRVTVASSLTIFGSGAGQALFCAAFEGPSCLSGVVAGMTISPGAYTTVAQTYERTLGAGTHLLNTAIRLDNPVAVSTNTANVYTSVRWNDLDAEFAG